MLGEDDGRLLVETHDSLTSTLGRALDPLAVGLLLVGLTSGAAMIARGTIEMRSGTAGRPYEVAGFLKDFHGVTLHAVLVLPALAWMLTRLGIAGNTRWRVVVLAVAAYVFVGLAVLLLDLTRL